MLSGAVRCSPFVGSPGGRQSPGPVRRTHQPGVSRGTVSAFGVWTAEPFRRGLRSRPCGTTWLERGLRKVPGDGATRLSVSLTAPALAWHLCFPWSLQTGCWSLCPKSVSPPPHCPHCPGARGRTPGSLRTPVTVVNSRLSPPVGGAETCTGTSPPPALHQQQV